MFVGSRKEDRHACEKTTEPWSRETERHPKEEGTIRALCATCSMAHLSWSRLPILVMVVSELLEEWQEEQHATSFETISGKEEV